MRFYPYNEFNNSTLLANRAYRTQSTGNPTDQTSAKGASGYNRIAPFENRLFSFAQKSASAYALVVSTSSSVRNSCVLP